MNQKIELNTNPKALELELVRSWLIEERNHFNEGFYCNWGIIEKAFNNKEFITLNHANYPIGFAVYSKSELYVEIEILEVKRNFRRKGIGQQFILKLESYFKSKGHVAFKLFCSPKESQGFWEKNGFVKFPRRGYTESDLTYFKPLVEIEKPTDSTNLTNKLELWNAEPYEIKNNAPQWTWKIDMTLNKLLKPIIHPCNNNWNLRWTKNASIVREHKVKHFNKNTKPIHCGPFLIIYELFE
ncbi:GNAT family N-acetyltransferase [uncultured Imperialibacter sp.]|uniref:GNAT family N-acetyltransferase n=1 Tax=uncultured Imperialibacter sp. TaxID=1672639 RepID=UPI0030DCB71E|tara:strand:+ start:18497 stop:19219 length:723 start_codon:yes stop_codon:yes gene_type:complete